MKRPFSALLIVAVLTAVLVAAGPALAWPGGSHAQSLDLQEDFNYVGAAVKSMTDSTGHVVNYIDQGEEGWRTVVLIGGAGTGARAFELTEFVRDLREELGIRVICVERNGIGMTEFEPAGADGKVIPADAGDAALALADPVKTREMYARDVLEVLDKEGVGKFSIIGISGGGPYTGELARQAGRRVRSIHLAVALYQSTPGGGYPDPAFLATFKSYIINPMWWWDMTGTTADLIPGWQEAAYEEAAWAAFVRGQDADPHAVAMDYTVYKMTPPDVSMVTAPVYTYYGELDTTVPLVNRDRWVAAYSSATLDQAAQLPGRRARRAVPALRPDPAGRGRVRRLPGRRLEGQDAGDPGGQVGVVRRPRRDAGHPGVGDCATAGELRADER